MKYYYITSLCILFLTACEAFRDQDLDPHYLKLDKVSVTTSVDQGAATHNIRDAWVYTQDDELGPFELPVTLPVLSDVDSTEYSIFAGVRKNGQSGSPIIYPFLKPAIFTIDTEPGEVYERDLTFDYYDNIVFEFIEDFDANHVFTLDADNFDGSNLTIVEDSTNLGNTVGQLYVNKENFLCEVITASTFLPDNFAGRTYLEIDYKNEVPLAIGVQKNIFNSLQNEFIILLREQEDFNKVYVDISSYISDESIGQFSLILSANIDPFGNLEEGRVLVDNVKLLHF